VLKHIGRHGQEKVVVVFNTVPGEEHMALVIYSTRLPSMIHDEVMKVLESTAGQTSKNLGDALFRNIMPDGNNTLTTLHQAGFLKKVQTKQVILNPNAKTSVRLDELNEILAKMETGEEAIKQMADLDASRGFADNKKIDAPREVGEPVVPTQASTAVDGILSDEDLAMERTAQADKYRKEAANLIAEAKRLEQEAKALTPKAKNGRKTTVKEKA
jgi:hypothetical protein